MKNGKYSYIIENVLGHNESSNPRVVTMEISELAQKYQ